MGTGHVLDPSPASKNAISRDWDLSSSKCQALRAGAIHFGGLISHMLQIVVMIHVIPACSQERKAQTFMAQMARTDKFHNKGLGFLRPFGKLTVPFQRDFHSQ